MLPAWEGRRGFPWPSLCFSWCRKVWWGPRPVSFPFPSICKPKSLDPVNTMIIPSPGCLLWPCLISSLASMPRCLYVGEESHSLIEKDEKGSVGLVPWGTWISSAGSACWWKILGCLLGRKKSFPVVSVSPDDVKRTPFWCGGTLLSKLPSAASMRVNKCWVWVIFISEWDVSRTSATQHPLLSWGMKLTPLLGFKTSSSSYHFWSAALVWLWHHFLGLLLSLVRSRRNQKSMTFCWKQKFQCAFFILIRHLIQLWSRMTFASNILWSEIDCN